MRQVTLKEKERSLNNAVASVEMEGYSVPAGDKKFCMDVFNGKFSKEDFINSMLERCRV